MYFKSFPKVQYQFPDGAFRAFTNLSLRPAIAEAVLKEGSNLENYTIGEGETPETIAYDLYNDVNMHWIIMLSNDMLNLYKDWPKNSQQFKTHIYNKYRVHTDILGVERTLTDLEVNEFITFEGTPSGIAEENFNSFITRSDDSEFIVTIRPHHFENEEGDMFSYETIDVVRDAWNIEIENYNDLTPVSIWDWETDLNERKRTIFVPVPEVAHRIDAELKKILHEQS